MVHLGLFSFIKEREFATMEKFTIAAVGCIAYLVISAVIDLFTAWILWLIYNAIAPNFHWPHAGYWTMFYIVLGLGIIASFFKSSSSSNKK